MKDNIKNEFSTNVNPTNVFNKDYYDFIYTKPNKCLIECVNVHVKCNNNNIYDVLDTSNMIIYCVDKYDKYLKIISVDSKRISYYFENDFTMDEYKLCIRIFIKNIDSIYVNIIGAHYS